MIGPSGMESAVLFLSAEAVAPRLASSGRQSHAGNTAPPSDLIVVDRRTCEGATGQGGHRAARAVLDGIWPAGYVGEFPRDEYCNGNTCVFQLGAGVLAAGSR